LESLGVGPPCAQQAERIVADARAEDAALKPTNPARGRLSPASYVRLVDVGVLPAALGKMQDSGFRIPADSSRRSKIEETSCGPSEEALSKRVGPGRAPAGQQPRSTRSLAATGASRRARN
jgi:hypothetical protein